MLRFLQARALQILTGRVAVQGASFFLNYSTKEKVLHVPLSKAEDDLTCRKYGVTEVIHEGGLIPLRGVGHQALAGTQPDF
jgi:hypothetical protein